MSIIFRYSYFAMKKITNQYNNFSETYSKNVNYDKKSNVAFYQHIDFNLTNKKLLDIGCGDGVDLYKFQKLGAVVYGIDPSKEFIDISKKNNPTGILKQGMAELIPFNNETFDVVVSKWALQTCSDLPKVLYEVGRVLKKNGLFVLLSKHPWMQWMEKNRDYGNGVDYYEQKIVTSNIYEGKIVLKEPTHTINDYLNSEFLNQFEIMSYEENTDFPASEQIDGKIYPTYFIIKARKK